MSLQSNRTETLRHGLAAGALAWVAGVAVTYFLGIAEVNFTFAFFVNAAPVAGSLVMYIFTHGWVVSALRGVDVSGIEPFTLLPIALLVVAGYLVASRAEVESMEDGVTAGATVAVGYGLLAALSLVVLLTGDYGMNDFGEALVQLAVAGVAFPVVFGGMGGVLGS